MKGPLIVLIGLVAAAGQGSEAEVKAAFLHKFTQFVEWPEDAFEGAESPYVVGVLGTDVLGAALDESLKGKKVNGRGFKVVRAVAARDLPRCHVVYVSPSEAGRKAETLKALGRSPALVVGDAEGFAEAGAAINFVLEDRRVRLEINPAAVGRRGLKVSSKLLQVSRIVKDRSKTP